MEGCNLIKSLKEIVSFVQTKEALSQNKIDRIIIPDLLQCITPLLEENKNRWGIAL